MSYDYNLFIEILTYTSGEWGNTPPLHTIVYRIRLVMGLPAFPTQIGVLMKVNTGFPCLRAKYRS